MAAEDVLGRVRGIDYTTADETLAETVNSQTFSGISARVEFDCEPIWDEMTDLGKFDIELESGGEEMVWIEVCFKPVTWLRLQMGASEAAWGSSDPEAFLYDPLHKEANINRVKEMVEAINERQPFIPQPYLELDMDGHITSFQEGRHRGVAAYYADVRLMPVYIFLDPFIERGDPQLDPPSEFNIGAILEADAPPELEV